MGDRCYLEIRAPKASVPILCSELNVEHNEWAEHVEGGLCLEVEEANYAWASQLASAASEGAWFVTSNGTGIEYGPGASVGCEGLYHEVQLDANGMVCVEVCWREGKVEVDQAQINAARMFFELSDRVEARLKEEKS